MVIGSKSIFRADAQIVPWLPSFMPYPSRKYGESGFISETNRHRTARRRLYGTGFEEVDTGARLSQAGLVELLLRGRGEALADREIEVRKIAELVERSVGTSLRGRFHPGLDRHGLRRTGEVLHLLRGFAFDPPRLALTERFDDDASRGLVLPGKWSQRDEATQTRVVREVIEHAALEDLPGRRLSRSASEVSTRSAASRTFFFLL